MSRRVAATTNGPEIGRTAGPATRYYEIRYRSEPYDVPMPLVVEARDFNQVLKKYPNAELIGMVGEHAPSVPRRLSPPVVTQPSNIQIISQPLTAGWQQSHGRLHAPRRCGTCGRT